MKLVFEFNNMKEVDAFADEWLGRVPFKELPKPVIEDKVPEEILTPVVEAPVAEPAAEEAPLKEETPSYTHDQLRKILADLNKKYPDEKPASKLIKQIGYGKLTEVPVNELASLAKLVSSYAAD